MIGRMTTTGQITEYAVPSGYPTSITASPDGALWFTAITPSSVNRIDTAGTIVQYLLATSFDKPGAIVPGPDGALWFTIYSADKIGRLGAAASDEDRQLRWDHGDCHVLPEENFTYTGSMLTVCIVGP